jgi:hypothetical protein
MDMAVTSQGRYRHCTYVARQFKQQSGKNPAVVRRIPANHRIEWERMSSVQSPGVVVPMSALSTAARDALARKRTGQTPRSEQPPARDRIDLRADPAWVARIERQAQRRGISVSAYLRQAGSLALEQDEATDPQLKGEEE